MSAEVHVLYGTSGLLDEVGQTTIGVGLAGGKVHLVKLVFEGVLEGERVVVLLFVVVVAVEGRRGEGDILASLEPAAAALSPFLEGEDGDLHALLVEGALLDYVEQGESAETSAGVAHPEEEPVVVAVGVEVVLDDQLVLFDLWRVGGCRVGGKGGTLRRLSCLGGL
jgi:hypothetical protein